jgi:hypothetical protein
MPVVSEPTERRQVRRRALVWLATVGLLVLLLALVAAAPLFRWSLGSGSVEVYAFIVDLKAGDTNTSWRQGFTFQSDPEHGDDYRVIRLGGWHWMFITSRGTSASGE